ncbi:MAG: tRNA (adenosine(37)-N6)-threonylcarbamoyltransferase complex dimerization subunit type 1 TsaB [Acidobacteria bacterium]|nr:tRNA (adenosine(37)-N6)-threonylcarbamoyltransferase complex dimerization subunit type 1 TsaB [Acidobacteriota bacterium]
MLLLAVDTSGKFGSIALARCGPQDNACAVLDVVALEGGTFSAQLVPQIAALLAGQGLTKVDLEGFAVVSGPGSFTGLRVGLSAIKALGEILSQPIAPVSLLEAVAITATTSGKILAALDAGRNEVYAAPYEGGAPQGAERLLSREEFLTVASGHTIITPDSSLLSTAQSAGLAVQAIERPRSDVIARLGWQKIQHGEIVSPEALEANYIRRSDAEIFSQPRT